MNADLSKVQCDAGKQLHTLPLPQGVKQKLSLLTERTEENRGALKRHLDCQSMCCILLGNPNIGLFINTESTYSIHQLLLKSKVHALQMHILRSGGTLAVSQRTQTEHRVHGALPISS